MTDAESATVHRTVEVGSSHTPEPSTPALLGGDPSIAIGRQIGRYVVLEEVGAGGMGQVYRAYDPKLRREVALKRLRVSKRSSAAAQARMLREAQSMAQLSHPNVVPVYDVDGENGSLFIAMEFVDGETLGDWLAARKRSWREMVGVFLQAGEGLAAAHGHGIVHRDFKPGNVIVGRDGRTRVMDFGLARSVESMPSSSMQSGEDLLMLGSGSASERTSTDSAALTQHGTVMGTPAYMAPEQHAGLTTDARTDQYAFCTALWEALYGSRPFRGKNLGELANAKMAPLPRPPASVTVPAAVHAVISRGLAVAPRGRWPDMATLLTALRRTQTRRNPWPAVGVAAIGLAVGGVLFAHGGEAPCRHGEEEVQEVWSDAARERVREGLAKSGVGFADSTVERVNAALDQYAAAYAAMHREACEETRVRHVQSDEALDLRMACLGERRKELGAVVTLLTGADESVAEKAVEVATGLTSISSCADVAALRSRVPLPSDPEVAREVEHAREVLRGARLSLRAGRNADALAATEAALKTAARLGYEPLVAEAELGHALALWSDGNAADALPGAQRALESALRLSMRHVAAEAAVTITGLVDSEQGRSAEARWLAHVGLALAEADAADPPLTAEAMLRVGNLYADEEKLVDAEPYFRGAVEHIETTLGPDHPSLVSVLSSWVSLLDALDRQEEADQSQARALELAQRVFGPDHPTTAAVIRQQAWRSMATGHYAKAEAGFAEAKGILEAALGPDHPSTVALLGTMAGSLAEQGRYEEAAANIVEAERRLGDNVIGDHPMRASLSHNLATIRAMQGDHRQAVERYGRAIEIRRRLGMKNDLAAALTKQAASLIELERFDEAQTALEEADRLDAEAHANGGYRSGQAGFELGKLARRRGDLKSALEHLERAWPFISKGSAPEHRAEAALELGRVLWEVGSDRTRGHDLVRHALEVVETSDADKALQIAEAARAWLSEHDAPDERAR